jgi:methyl-accepting chemotaxis protein
LYRSPWKKGLLMSTHELLEQWREATRAVELAERLAKMAEESVQRADQNAAGAQEIARMAERAAKSAERAAKSARAAADRAVTFAEENRSGRLGDANQTLVDTRTQETAARDRYHDAESVARNR